MEGVLGKGAFGTTYRAHWRGAEVRSNMNCSPMQLACNTHTTHMQHMAHQLSTKSCTPAEHHVTPHSHSSLSTLARSTHLQVCCMRQGPGSDTHYVVHWVAITGLVVLAVDRCN